MKLLLNNNTIQANNIKISGENLISDILILRAVRVGYKLDANNNRTDEISSIYYDCVDSKSFANFTLKVLSNKAVITQQEIEEAENAILIQVNPLEIAISPYAIEYGIAKVSIIAKEVAIVSN